MTLLNSRTQDLLQLKRTFAADRSVESAFAWLQVLARSDAQLHNLIQTASGAGTESAFRALTREVQSLGEQADPLFLTALQKLTQRWPAEVCRFNIHRFSYSDDLRKVPNFDQIKPFVRCLEHDVTKAEKNGTIESFQRQFPNVEILTTCFKESYGTEASELPPKLKAFDLGCKVKLSAIVDQVKSEKIPLESFYCHMNSVTGHPEALSELLRVPTMKRVAFRHHWPYNGRLQHEVKFDCETTLKLALSQTNSNLESFASEMAFESTVEALTIERFPKLKHLKLSCKKLGLDNKVFRPEHLFNFKFENLELMSLLRHEVLFDLLDCVDLSCIKSLTIDTAVWPDLTKYWKRFDKLERLVFRFTGPPSNHRLGIGATGFFKSLYESGINYQLKSLIIDAMPWGQVGIDALVNGEWPNLETLFVDERGWADPKRDWFCHLKLPRIKNFAIPGTKLTKRVVDKFIQVPWLSQLERVHLYFLGKTSQLPSLFASTPDNQLKHITLRLSESGHNMDLLKFFSSPKCSGVNDLMILGEWRRKDFKYFQTMTMPELERFRINRDPLHKHSKFFFDSPTLPKIARVEFHDVGGRIRDNFWE